VSIIDQSPEVGSTVMLGVSVSSRAFSIAMTAWAAKFCNSAIC
jgi:hypothetical protein